ncbi:type IV pilin protein [Dyella japonica]|uniref:Pilus assembly protein PilE n=1 Tax=Dyella japonica A8 TaxID=1217721 RepID=A0A075K5F2_9GAMM|nr:prepilin-type N-terminal cleavage/methylation domain-containing protein [Dyella japonica]AIF47403.1 hypothetical protein HY57_09025 [Dyella japonica A8]
MSCISRRQAGFTLLEIMIVVMIIGILSAIAYPQYAQYVTRSKLVDGMNGLSAYRVSMEQYYQDNRVYACPTTGPAYPTSQYFTFSCTVAADASNTAAQTFVAKATANANTPMNGLVYSIDNTNTRQTVSVPSGWTSATSGCWSTSKGGC